MRTTLSHLLILLDLHASWANGCGFLVVWIHIVEVAYQVAVVVANRGGHVVE